MLFNRKIILANEYNTYYASLVSSELLLEAIKGLPEDSEIEKVQEFNNALGQIVTRSKTIGERKPEIVRDIGLFKARLGSICLALKALNIDTEYPSALDTPLLSVAKPLTTKEGGV